MFLYVEIPIKGVDGRGWFTNVRQGLVLLQYCCITKGEFDTGNGTYDRLLQYVVQRVPCRRSEVATTLHENEHVAYDRVGLL